MEKQFEPMTKKHKNIFFILKEVRIKYALLCFLVLHTFILPSAAHGYILCKGNDGHVSIELNGTDLCCESSFMSSYNVKNVIIAGDTRVNCCLDTLITENNNEGFLLNTDDRVVYNLSSILIDFISDPLLSDQSNPRKTLLYSAPHLNISLLSFSTTISLQI